MPYDYTEIKWKPPNTNSRKELIKIVVNKFMEEDMGEGTENKATRYKYIIHEFENGEKLYLKKPANLRLGFDFQIWIENWKSQNQDGMPSLEEILEDIFIKKEENPKYSSLLFDAIEKIFRCEDDDKAIDWLKSKNVNFSKGKPFEVILKIIKWIFIEQDIRYWNFSGRYKFKEAIEKRIKN